jgi:hypothetical protein
MNWSSLLEGVGQAVSTVVLPAAATVATAYATAWARKQSAKADLEISRAHEELLKRQVLNIIKRVEEQGRREGLTSAEKQRLAADVIKVQIKQPNGTALTDQQAVVLMDTMLPDLRAEQALVDPPADVDVEPPLADVSRDLLAR